MKGKKNFLIILLSIVMFICCFAFVACDGGEEELPEIKTLTAPTNFTFDTVTGEFSFNATDAKAGYYFVRCFSSVGGVESTTYTVSSERINGGSVGAKSGTLDTSGFGWGDYNVKLVTFAAAGSGYTAPATQILKAQYGVGGILEKPEMLVMTEGSQVELVIDWYTINDYYMYQFLPTVTFRFYSDEALTTVVKTDTVDLHDLLATIDVHPAGGYIWGYSNDSMHKAINSTQGFLNDIYIYTMAAGDYWVTATANTTSDAFAESKASDAVKFTLTDTVAEGGAYVSAKTELWKAPSTMGVPVAMKNDSHSNRIDFAGNQTTASKIVTNN